MVCHNLVTGVTTLYSTMTSSSSLKMLFQKHRGSPVETLLPEELNLLIGSFLPSENPSTRAESLLFLSKFTSDVRQKFASQSDSDVATSVLVRTFAAPTESRLADTHEPATLAALCFLAALFQVDWAAACAIFSRDGLLDSVVESPELYPSSKAIPLAIANLLSQASGHKQCRPLVASPQVKVWLEAGMKQTAHHALRAAAAVALVKLSQGSESDAHSTGLGGISATLPGKPAQTHSSTADDKLVKLMKSLVITESPTSSSTLDAIEGLAYLSVQPLVKETLSSDPVFLERLITLAPNRPIATSFPASHADRNVDHGRAPGLDHGLGYGIAVIISNLCGYKPRLSDEERQIERLRLMTKEPGSGAKLSANLPNTSVDSDMLEDDDHVRIRGKRLVAAGVVDALSGIIKGLGGTGVEKRSMSVQQTVAKGFLSLAEEKANRGKILQGGGGKALLTIIRASLADSLPASDESGQKAVDRLEITDLLAIQALAKLSITSPPAAVFGSAKDSYVDAIRPFAFLLIHSSASSLQQFEALMALTNIASVSPDAAERVSAFRLVAEKTQSGTRLVGDIVQRTEALFLDSNAMLRRAATELACNLVGGAEGSFDYFGGAVGNNAKSRLQILVALSDVEDLPTRLAASGALATLTVSPHVCQSLSKLEMERHRLLPTLVELILPEIAREYQEECPEDESKEVAAGGDPGLVHRGMVCVWNIFANLDATEERKVMLQEEMV